MNKVNKNNEKINKVMVVSFLPGSGGPGIHSRDYISELSKRDVDVSWFYHGVYDIKLKPYLKRSTGENNVKVIEFRNSPNHHPGIAQPSPRNEISNHKIELAFLEAINEVKPQIVHFMDFAGYSASLLRICYLKNIKTINVHHSYWFICPKWNITFFCNIT
jgi:hypothetical protein